jgi:hypothetical protein
MAKRTSYDPSNKPGFVPPLSCGEKKGLSRKAAGVSLLARSTRRAASPPGARARVRLSGADALRLATASSRARLSDSVAHGEAFDWAPAPLHRRRCGFSLHPGEGLGAERGLVTCALAVGVGARSRDGTARFVAQNIFTRKRVFSILGVFNSSFSYSQSSPAR